MEELECQQYTSGLRLKAFAGFPTLRRSKIISLMAKSSLSYMYRGKKRKTYYININNSHSLFMFAHMVFLSQILYVCLGIVSTCAINWMILTKMLSGISLGTTLRDPLGKRVEMMVLRRLQTHKENYSTHIRVDIYIHTLCLVIRYAKE